MMGLCYFYGGFLVGPQVRPSFCCVMNSTQYREHGHHTVNYLEKELCITRFVTGSCLGPVFLGSVDMGNSFHG